MEQYWEHKTEEKEETRLQKLLRYWEEFQKPENQRSFELFKRQLAKLLKRIVPKKFQAEGVLGFEDPALTGMVFAGLASLMPFCGNSLNIAASFDEPVVELLLNVKGRVHIIWIASFVVRLLMDKNIRRLVKAYLKNR